MKAKNTKSKAKGKAPRKKAKKTVKLKKSALKQMVGGIADRCSQNKIQ